MSTTPQEKEVEKTDLLNPPPPESKPEPKAEEKPAPPQVAKKSNAGIDFANAKAGDMQAFFMRYMPSFMEVMDPKMGDFAKRQLGIAAQLIAGNETLRKCSPASIVGCLRQVVLSGLDLSISEVCLVPRGGICTYEIQAQGYRKMAYNSGNVSTMNAYIVYEGEEFDYEIVNGIEKIRHKPQFDSYGGKILAAYCVAVMKDGGVISRILPLAEIEKFRAMGGANNPAWKNNFPSMAITKAFKHLCKRLPLAFRERAALDYDEMPAPEIQDVAHEIVD